MTGRPAEGEAAEWCPSRLRRRNRATAVGVLGDVQGSRPGGFAAPRFRLAALLLLAVYLSLVLWHALRPLPAVWVPPANLEPLATVRADLARGPSAAVRGIGGGLLLCAPLGVLLPLVAGHIDGPRLVSLLRTTFAGAALSAAVELLQSGVPGQVSDVDAILLGAAGTALARLLLYPPVSRWVSRRSATTRRRSAPGGPVADRDGARSAVPSSRPAAVAGTRAPWDSDRLDVAGG